MEVATATAVTAQHRSKESGGGSELATCVRHSPRLYLVTKVELFKSVEECVRYNNTESQEFVFWFKSVLPTRWSP